MAAGLPAQPGPLPARPPWRLKPTQGGRGPAHLLGADRGVCAQTGGAAGGAPHSHLVGVTPDLLCILTVLPFTWPNQGLGAPSLLFTGTWHTGGVWMPTV